MTRKRATKADAAIDARVARWQAAGDEHRASVGGLQRGGELNRQRTETPAELAATIRRLDRQGKAAAKRGPGRPAKPARERAAETLTVRLYKEEAALLEKLMAARGESASDVLRAGLRALHAAGPAAD